jgi:hypothetical protein
VLRPVPPWGGIEERGGRGPGRGGRGGVVVHPRGQARAVVQEVELPGEGLGVGYASLLGQGGEQGPHPVMEGIADVDALDPRRGGQDE